MASIVEKYEQIFASDPKSRIFVELARALLDRGEAARAIDVCRRGLDHHPSSILGRVIWGRALLETGDRKAAIDQFEIAIALDPGSPYAYNLVGEALLGKNMPKEALPVLARAAELQPADERVKAWYAEAKRRVRGDMEPQPARAAGNEDHTEPYRPIPFRAMTPAPILEDDPFVDAAAQAAAAPPPLPGDDGSRTRPSPILPPALPPGQGPQWPAVTPPIPSNAPRAPSSLLPDLEDDATTEVDLVLKPAAAPPPATEPGDTAPFDGLPAGPPPAPPPAAPPPLRPPATTPAPPPLPSQKSVLDLIPENAAAPIRRMTGIHKPPQLPGEREQREAEAERIAASYAEDLRQKMLATTAPHSAAAGRGRLVMGVIAVLAVVAALGVFLAVRSARTAEVSRTALTRARAGLARDTAGSLREAATLLAEARERTPDDPGLVSLSAQVSALLAADYGDPAALALARELVGSGAAGDGGVAARLLLAVAGTERAEAEAAALEARPAGPPLLTTLAGELLIARGEVDAGRGRLEIAARSSPPMLRALAGLGDSALASGDPDAALDFYAPALAAHRTHPRSVLGAAEARLQLGRDLEKAREDLEAVEADPASPPPAALRVRFATVLARVLSALGDTPAAVTRLKTATQALGESAALSATLAEVQLAAHAWDGAEAAAQRAVALAPKDPALRVLLARALTGRGKPEQALRTLAGREERPARVQRALALQRLGRYVDARAELEKTVRDGRMPSDAAVLYALSDVALGRADRARPLLERIAGAANPPPLAAVALGRACEALADLACAEKAYREAVKRDPRAPEAHAALGGLLAAKGDGAGALAALGEAVRLDPSDLDARRALGQAKLLGGQFPAARADLDAVLLAHPRDAAALTLVSAAWLGEGQPAEARRAAERAVAAAPKDPGALLAAARAAAAAKDGAAARSYATRAQKAGAAAAEVSKVLAEAGSAPPVAAKAAAAKPAAGKKRK